MKSSKLCHYELLLRLPLLSNMFCTPQWVIVTYFREARLRITEAIRKPSRFCNYELTIGFRLLANVFGTPQWTTNLIETKIRITQSIWKGI